MADLEWKGLVLVERPNRPADSPIWDGSDGLAGGVRVLLAANLAENPPQYSAVVRCEGTRARTAEGPSFAAALAQAFALYAQGTLEELNHGPRVRDATASDQGKAEAVRQNPGNAPAPARVR